VTFPPETSGPAASALPSGRLLARSTSDRPLLRAFLERDRIFAAYALCDLDASEFGRTNWGIALRGGETVAIVLEYGGVAPQPLFTMGEPEGIAAVLGSVIQPRVAYLAARPESLAAIGRVYRVDPGPKMVRMWVDRAGFRPFPGLTARLLPTEVGDLNRLYDMGFAAWLPAAAVAEGVYHGVRIRGQLVAAAGTHVVSREAGIGVVGNVLTHRDYRGRGLAKTTTSAVTQELLRTCQLVVLNVRADNDPAIAAYRALGYQDHAVFEERLVHRRASAWDGIMGSLRRLFPHASTSKEP
jgi:ribosomal protein S18 acetylase RimI-like enzyme